MIQKRVLVTGITDQDGAYLSLYCSVQGLRIYGVKIARRYRAPI